MVAWDEGIKSKLKIIGFILGNLFVLFLFVFFITFTGAIVFGQGYVPLWEFNFVVRYFKFSIPLLFIGFFTSRMSSKKVGLAFPLSHFTMFLVDQIIDIPYPAFALFEPTYYFKILSILYLAYLGIVFAWAGSLIGETFRPRIHKEHLKLDLKKGFLATYIFYIIIYIYFLFMEIRFWQYPITWR